MARSTWAAATKARFSRLTRPARSTTFFDTTELEVHALALAPDGSLYAATSPDGRIYKIDRSGKGAPFFDPEDKYIWSLALDAPGQRVRRHGREGADLQNHARRQRQPVLRDEGDARHRADVRAQRPAAGRHRRARDDCSASIQPGKAFLLLDSTHQEIRAIRLDPQGNIYLAALSGRTTLHQPAAGVDAIRAPRPRLRASPSRPSRPK